MGKLKRGSKIFVLAVLNPHRILLAIAEIILLFPEWLNDKADDASKYLSSLEEKLPLFGKSISKSLTEDYREKFSIERKRRSLDAANSILPSSGEGEKHGQQR